MKAISKPLPEQEKDDAQRITPAQQDGVVSGLPSLEAFGSDLHLVELLRHGDEAAFTQLFNRYYASMLRLAHIYVPNDAKEIVQETWSTVLTHLSDFKGQIALKIWIFRSLRDTIKVHVHAESRSIPDFATLDILAIYAHPTVAPWRFFPQGNPETEGRWEYPPQRWSGSAQGRFSSSTVREYLQQMIERLPLELREIITLRDIEGWTSEEVCSLLEITGEKQRVLLHHARAQVRQALEHYFKEEQA